MSVPKTNKPVHDAAVVIAESQRQVSTVGANQATAKAADITFYRAALASAITNGVSPASFSMALQALGTGGT